MIERLVLTICIIRMKQYYSIMIRMHIANCELASSSRLWMWSIYLNGLLLHMILLSIRTSVGHICCQAQSNLYRLIFRLSIRPSVRYDLDFSSRADHFMMIIEIFFHLKGKQTCNATFIINIFTELLGYLRKACRCVCHAAHLTDK